MVKICEDLAKNLVRLILKFDSVLIYGLKVSGSNNDIFFVSSCLKPIDVFATGLVPLAWASKTNNIPNDQKVEFLLRFQANNSSENILKFDLFKLNERQQPLIDHPVNHTIISRASYEKQIVYFQLNYELNESLLDQVRNESYCFNCGIDVLIGENYVFRKDQKLTGDCAIDGLFTNIKIPVELNVTRKSPHEQSPTNESRNYKITNYAVIARKRTVNELYDLLVDNLRGNINKCLQFYRNNSKPSNLQTFDFRLAETSFEFVFVNYDSSKSDKELGAVRGNYVRAIGLSTTRPLIRKGNFEAANLKYNQIVNIHRYVKMDEKGRINCLVDGSYLYCHYDQDGEQDNGWGCAYRSLQTIISYFKLKGYTDQPLPRLRDIQETLVMLGDKPLEFLGSRQWIGSIELSYCLDSLIDIQSRIIHLSAGQSIDTIADQLIDHFRCETGAPPVMIGSGQLAHTILGVSAQLPDWTNYRYLVLDPHYSGSDADPKSVIARGACAWKTASFWKTSASNRGANYANLCLPIVPQTFF